ncbi:hypothetical protein [Sinorhizobium fredii]|uniref:NurA domain-containing protein n=1 Tax=Sinorhizobium fredii (strain USDA 257) TaxID=1185652 RepID=I3X9A1_SINF2|nr:hypothetical protein [Sinorhizobium fredii]AFL52457.1 hypothetical protein USDA257_c39130 [Sinorhizobium fredii USDA 257]
MLLIDLKELSALPPDEIPSPSLFRDMEQVETLDAVLPGANVVRKGLINDTPSAFFRESVHDLLTSRIDKSWETLGETLAAITYGHDTSRTRCPVEECEERLTPGKGAYPCHCHRAQTIFESDSLRFVERFNPTGSNGEAHGEVRHLLEVLALFNILRFFAAEPDRLVHLRDNVFILDGPLAMFGHAAWLTPYLRKELARMNDLCRSSGFDIALFGFEKSGQFVNHFEMIDFDEEEGPRKVFSAGTVITPDADYINRRITLRPKGAKVHGDITYFGRKVLYKTRSGDHAVITTAMVDGASQDFTRNDSGCYPRLGDCLNVLDELSTYLYRDGFMPLIRAHAHAAIPIQRGSDILRKTFIDTSRPPKVSEGPASSRAGSFGKP